MVSDVRPVSTTDMQVTSIRLEAELKERLKELADHQGYQALIREILWDYVHQQGQKRSSPLASSDIRARVAATAHREEFCMLTGQLIPAHSSMYLGLTTDGTWVPLSLEAL